MDGLGSASGEDHASSHVEVVLPGNGDFEGVGGNDFEGGEHNCSCEVGIGDLGGGVAEGVAEGRKDVPDPDGDSIGRFSMLQQTCSVACRICQEEM